MSFITETNSESGARVRRIFSLKEHLLLLHNLFQRTQHIHPHNTGWGACVRTHIHTTHTHTHKDTHPSPHYKFRNAVSISPWDLFAKYLIFSSSLPSYDFPSSQPPPLLPPLLIFLFLTSHPFFLFFAFQELEFFSDHDTSQMNNINTPHGWANVSRLVARTQKQTERQGVMFNPLLTNQICKGLSLWVGMSRVGWSRWAERERQKHWTADEKKLDTPSTPHENTLTLVMAGELWQHVYGVCACEWVYYCTVGELKLHKYIKIIHIWPTARKNNLTIFLLKITHKIHNQLYKLF